MSDNQRKAVYIALVAANAALGSVVAQGALPGVWASVAAVASILLTAGMKAFGDKAPE